MKKLIILVFFLISINTYSNDSTVFNTILKESPELSKIEKKIDSMSLVLKQIQYERNYYQTALESQTNIFSMIIMIIIAGFGFISFISFKIEIRRNRKMIELKIRDFKNDFSAVESKINKQEKLVNIALANLSVSIAETIYKDHNIEKIYYYITSACYYGRNKAYDGTNLCLKLALENMDKVHEEPTLKEKFNKEVHLKHNEKLKELLTYPNDDIIVKTALLFSKINNI